MQVVNFERRGIILAGGGIDSSVCMHVAKESRTACRAIHVNYGQIAAQREWAAVTLMAERYAHSALQLTVSGGQPHCGGEAVGRNSMLVHLALLQKDDAESCIYIGIHKGTSFYDCSQRFFELCSTLVAEQTDGRVRLIAPLLEYTKAEIVEYARREHVTIADTYSCQSGGEACGQCLSCRDRKGLGC